MGCKTPCPGLCATWTGCCCQELVTSTLNKPTARGLPGVEVWGSWNTRCSTWGSLRQTDTSCPPTGLSPGTGAIMWWGEELESRMRLSCCMNCLGVKLQITEVLPKLPKEKQTTLGACFIILMHFRVGPSFGPVRQCREGGRGLEKTHFSAPVPHASPARNPGWGQTGVLSLSHCWEAGSQKLGVSNFNSKALGLTPT